MGHKEARQGLIGNTPQAGEPAGGDEAAPPQGTGTEAVPQDEMCDTLPTPDLMGGARALAERHVESKRGNALGEISEVRAPLPPLRCCRRKTRRFEGTGHGLSH